MIRFEQCCFGWILVKIKKGILGQLKIFKQGQGLNRGEKRL
jgi:hypothetical protein